MLEHLKVACLVYFRTRNLRPHQHWSSMCLNMTFSQDWLQCFCMLHATARHCISTTAPCKSQQTGMKQEKLLPEDGGMRVCCWCVTAVRMHSAASSSSSSSSSSRGSVWARVDGLARGAEVDSSSTLSCIRVLRGNEKDSRELSVTN